MGDTEVVEHFHGVYLLYCMNPKYKGRTYIGYTVDPHRRIKQHNAGKAHGGALRTSKRGPWNMVLIVHGFLSNTSALRFEWAWQHPHSSRRLKHVPGKKSQQKVFEYRLLILTEMLKVGPWCRLPLTVRWLDYEFFQTYCSHVTAPMHMPVCCGKVVSQKVKSTIDISQRLDESPILCTLCDLPLEKKQSVTCIKPGCLLVTHMTCLASLFCENGMILPIQGTCPACKTDVLWGDLIRKKIGCYRNLEEVSSSDDSCT